MEILLFRVEDRFLIRGRGLVLVPGIVAEDRPFREWTGLRIVLRRPDHSEVEAEIRGIDISTPTPPSPRRPILVSGDFTKDDVPVGTEVWSEPRPSGAKEEPR